MSPSGRAGNIRLDKLNTSDDVLNLIRETAKTKEGRINYQKPRSAARQRP